MTRDESASQINLQTQVTWNMVASEGRTESFQVVKSVIESESQIEMCTVRRQAGS